MHDASLLGPWVHRFLMEHLTGERNLARHIQRSYRDALRLLLPSVARRARKPIDRLAVTDVSADRVREFLNDLEEKRGCGIATRNQRLAAIHALARFIALQAPELIQWCGQVCALPFKKAPRGLVTYLEKAEMDALLASPDLSTAQGRRDHALLLFLYNTRARADEAAQALIEDLSLPQVPERDLASVLIRGKGNKPRRCPLWAQTVRELTVLVRERTPKRACLPESVRPADHPLRHPHSGGALHGSGGRASGVTGCQAGQSAHDPAYDGDALVTLGGGHQHDPGVSGACVAGDDERIRGSRSGDESQGVGKL
jgi:site-specific recombinase XerD